MPEGPEIKIAADEVAAALVGHPTAEIFFAFEHLKHYEAQLRSQIVYSVEARGKAMLIRFANGLNIYSHNQLYGKWLISLAYNYPDTKRQLRVAIHNAQKSALLYSASDIEVLADDALDSHPFLSKLGPNLLDPNVTLQQLIERFLSPEFTRRRLVTLLLDQHFLAGMGNYLRSEVLFVAQIQPSLRPCDCSTAQIERLAQVALSLTRQSYQTKGITNDLQRAAQLREAGYGFEDYRFWVFRRENKACYVCGTLIIKTVRAGRRLYFCPQCQLVG